MSSRSCADPARRRARSPPGSLTATSWPSISASAVAQARASAADEIASGRISVRHVAVEDLVLQAHEDQYDIVFAVRVGSLDGRHPKAGEHALLRIAMATTVDARLFIEGGDPLRELPIPEF